PRFPAFRHLSHPGGIRPECQHPGLRGVLDPAPAESKRDHGQRRYRGTRHRLRPSHRCWSTDLASGAHDGSVLRSATSLPGSIHAECHRRSSLGPVDRRPQSIVWGEFSTDVSGGLYHWRNRHPFAGAHFQPYRRGLWHLESTDYDISLPPRVAQFRLDLRLIAQRLALFFGTRFPLRGLRLILRAVLASYEILLISALMQVGLALPMACYFHRATVMGLPANVFAIPLAGALMPAAVAALILSYVSTALARIPAWIAAGALEGITGTIRWIGS